MKRRFTTAFAIWTFFVFVASLIPGGALPPVNWLGMLQFDKIVHLCLYFAMCILMYLSLIYELKTRLSGNQALMASAVFAILFGLLMEILQSNLNTGRYFDIFDVVANTIGVFIAVLIVYFKTKR